MASNHAVFPLGDDGKDGSTKMNTARAPIRSSHEADKQKSSWASEFKATLLLAWPLIIAQMAQVALSTTDVVMMGWLGPTSLAAGTLATSFIMPIFLFGTGVVGAVSPLVAQARGSRDIRAVRRIVRQGFWVGLLLAALMVPFIMQIRTIFGWLGQDPLLAARAEEYAQIAAFMVFPALGMFVLRSLLSAFEATRIILVVALSGVVVNFIGNYGLMFGNFGLPRLELRGAGIVIVVTNLFMFLALLIFVLRHKRLKRFHILARFWKPDWSRFRKIFRVGMPIGLTVLAEVGLFTAAALLMGLLGTDEVAAHAVALQCGSMAFMIPLGLGIAATVRVGIAYGRNDAEGIRKAGWAAFMIGIGFMIMSCTLFLTAAPAIVSLFLNPADPGNSNALTLAASFLVIAGIFQLADGAQVVAAHALRGLSDTRIPMLLAILGYWGIGLPVSYFLGFTLEWRGIGIWIGLATGLAAVAVVLVTRFAMRERLGLLPARSF